MIFIANVTGTSLHSRLDYMIAHPPHYDTEHQSATKQANHSFILFIIIINLVACAKIQCGYCVNN